MSLVTDNRDGRTVAPAGRPAPVRTRRRTDRRFVKLVRGTIGSVGFLLLWELLPALGVVQEQYLPPASAVLAELLTLMSAPGFWVAVGDTMTSWGIGLVIATAAAVLMGFGIGSSTFLRKFTNSTIEFLRPIPSVALIPLAVLLFGVDIGSTLMLIIYACFWQVLIQVLYGVADVDTVARETARTFGLGRLAVVRYVVWPTAMPYLMTGIRLAAAVALILSITAELVIGTPGLGLEIALAQSGGAVVTMYALIVATGGIGVLINTVMRAVEKRALAWHSSVRSEVIL